MMPSHRLTPHEDVLFQELPEEAVLLDTRTDGCFRLNSLGSKVWSLLQSGLDAPAIALQIAEYYDLPAHQAQADVEVFLERLKALELLEGQLIEGVMM